MYYSCQPAVNNNQLHSMRQTGARIEPEESVLFGREPNPSRNSVQIIKLELQSFEKEIRISVKKRLNIENFLDDDKMPNKCTFAVRTQLWKVASI